MSNSTGNKLILPKIKLNVQIPIDRNEEEESDFDDEDSEESFSEGETCSVYKQIQDEIPEMILPFEWSDEEFQNSLYQLRDSKNFNSSSSSRPNDIEPKKYKIFVKPRDVVNDIPKPQIEQFKLSVLPKPTILLKTESSESKVQLPIPRGLGSDEIKITLKAQLPILPKPEIKIAPKVQLTVPRGLGSDDIKTESKVQLSVLPKTEIKIAPKVQLSVLPKPVIKIAPKVQLAVLPKSEPEKPVIKITPKTQLTILPKPQIELKDKPISVILPAKKV